MNARARCIALQHEAAHYAAQARISRDMEHDAAKGGTYDERACYAWQAVHCQILAQRQADAARAILASE